jgi:preprotein translocase subunit SecF
MSDAIMKKSYTVVCVRSTGQPMELETVSDYTAAINSAKEALTNKNNTEVRVIESKYDQATRKDKKQVVKVLTAENAGNPGGAAAGTKRGTNKPGVSREVANQATKSIINIVIAVTVLVLLAGVMVPLIMR